MRRADPYTHIEIAFSGGVFCSILNVNCTGFRLRRRTGSTSEATRKR